MFKKAKGLTMIMALLAAATMTTSHALAVPPKVGVVCVQNVGSLQGGGAFPQCAVAAARMLEYAGAEVRMIDSGDILDNNILNTIDLIVFPGGYATTYTEFYASDTGDAVRNAIRDFISNGGAYMGLCAGAYFAADVVVWPGPGGKPTRYEYYLDLLMGDAVGPLDDISDYPDDPYALTTVRMVDPDFSWNGTTYTIGYLWGPYFTGTEGGPLPPEVDVVGRYDYEVGGQPGKYDGKPAMIKFLFGNGRVFLSGPHPEYEESDVLSNSRDWSIGDDYGTDNPSGPVADPDTEWDMMKDILGWLCPTKTVGPGYLPPPHSNTAAVYATLGTSARVVWPTMKMLRSLGIEPYAYDSHANDEITIDKFNMAIFPNGHETVMDNYIDKPTLDTFLANGGDFIGIGGGAKIVGVELNYWDSGQDLTPPAQHGMEDMTIIDPDTGSGVYSVAFWDKEASADGHHWDGSDPTLPDTYDAISWTSSHVAGQPGAISVAYFTDEGSDQICMVKYPYGTGGSKILMSSVDPGTEEGSDSIDECQWDDGVKGYSDPDSEWPLIGNIFTWMGY
ncbi:hypothetical protein KAX97_15045 [candidate division WOR-3 bacterium]|nr:hypothetical protein [Pseudomonadota bacterium]MCK4252761.1 hypothetical protein [candidate division WOR-3 bacterium]